MKKLILWEKYENSVNKDLNISKLLMVGKFIKDEKTDEDKEEQSYSYKDEEEDDEEEGQMVMQFPITQSMLYNIKLCGDYECWMGHANFDLSDKYVQELNRIEGVEYLDPMTRYRFVIGLGKQFDFTNVRLDIETKLGVINDDG